MDIIYCVTQHIRYKIYADVLEDLKLAVGSQMTMEKGCNLAVQYWITTICIVLYLAFSEQAAKQPNFIPAKFFSYMILLLPHLCQSKIFY